MKKPASGLLRIGTSGWNYDHWRGPFYPEVLPKRAWFSYYADVFDTVEINNTFYNLPRESTFAKWLAAAPAGFVYALKASRYITHVKRLKDSQDALKLFLGRARLLESKLGPVLYQLPPRFGRDLPRLTAFLELLPRDITHVFEFRNPQWFCDETYALLERYGAAFCAHDMPGQAAPRLALGKVAYVRFHGAQAKYAGSYSAAVLRDWALWLAENVREDRTCHVYFNNDAEGHAPHDAGRLLKGLERL